MSDHEIYFKVTADEMKEYDPIDIVYGSLINTTTYKLAHDGWQIIVRQNPRHGRPKIRLYDPHGNLSFSLKYVGPDKTVIHNTKELFDWLYEKALLSSALKIQVPRNIGFVVGDPLTPLERKQAAQIKEMTRNNPANIIINNLQMDLMAAKNQIQRLKAQPGIHDTKAAHTQIEKLVAELSDVRGYLNEFESTSSTLKTLLRSEVTLLKTEVIRLQSRLHEIENEDSLATMERLNRNSYETHLARPAHLREAEEQMERIFKAVSELIERISNTTQIKIMAGTIGHD
jgi:hypothetical protein